MKGENAFSSFILHPSPFILHPLPFILHPLPFILSKKFYVKKIPNPITGKLVINARISWRNFAMDDVECHFIGDVSGLAKRSRRKQ